LFKLFSNARLNFNGVSRLRTEFSSLFHSLTEEGMNDEFVEESLQKGTITNCTILFLFLVWVGLAYDV
jgi:hypothetical protein